MTRVLVVEKGAALRARYAAALEENGFAVITASDFSDALEKNRIHLPNVVIIDPTADRGGLETAVELTKANQTVSVIFNTASPSQIGDDFSAWVADALATKREDTSELCRVVRDLAAGKQGG